MDFGLATCRERGTEPISEHAGITHIAFPQNNHTPTQCLKGFSRDGIALDIARQLRNPIVAARPRHVRKFAAGMLMPKASVNLDDSTMARQDDIWLAGQVTPVQPEPIPHGMKAPAHKKLRLRVLLSVASHDPRSCCRDGRFVCLHPISCACAVTRRTYVHMALRKSQHGLGSNWAARVANVSR